MTYLSVSDFKHGIDRRRPQVNGAPGALWTARNCVLSRGGDIEACKKFVAEYALPAGTYGLAGVNARPVVFGTAAAPGGLPADISYKQLTYTGGSTIVKLHDAKPFAGKMYAIAEFADGDVRHFYDGVEVAEWRTVADASWTYDTVAKLLAEKINARSDVSAKSVDNRVLVEAVTEGTGFTCTTGTTDDANVAGSLPTATKTTLQANVAAVAEVRATSTITITGGTVSAGVNYVSQIAVGINNLLATPINFVLDNSATANAVALAITSAAVAGYSATAVGPIITILAPPGLGATINGTAPVVTLAGNVTKSQTSFAGGVTAVAAATQLEQIAISATAADALDTWTITVAGTAYKVTGRSSMTGTLIHVVARRLWIPVGPYVRYCKLSAPTVWSTTAAPATDPGFIDTSTDSEGNDDIIAIAEHNGNTGFFSQASIRVYSLDTDATLIAIVQTLPSVGCVARKAPLQYGNSDVYFPSPSGLKSMRSRLGYNFAYTLDVGDAIGSYLTDFMAEVGESVTRAAVAVIDPVESRYMLAIKNRVFVFSDYVGASVSGWTDIAPGFDIDDFVQIGLRVMARSGNTIYVYGGLSGTEYPAEDELPIEVETGFLDANDPASKKADEGFGMAGEGDWAVEILPDPNNTDKTVDVGTIAKIMYPDAAARFPSVTSHAAVRLTCSSGGRAKLSSFFLGFNRTSA